MNTYSFVPAETGHHRPIMQLLSAARLWHAEQGVGQWPVYDPDLVRREIEAQVVHVLLADGAVVGTALVLDEDPLIWNDGTPALYIHRLATDRTLKGQGLCRRMVDAVELRAIADDRTALRLDCWADNEALKAFYVSLGFVALGNLAMGEARSLPAHYWNSVTTLFERRVSATAGAGTISRRPDLRPCA